MNSIKLFLAVFIGLFLAACGGGGGGGSNVPPPSVTVPGAPTTVTASPGNLSATVNFTAPANSGGAAITGYTVTSSPGNISATGTTTPILVTGLTNGTAYTFTVVATNSAGNSAASTASNSVTPSATPIVPSAPTAVTATAGNTTATVTFTASASNGGAAITGYTVTSSPAGGTDSNAGTTGSTHSITGLINGTPYTFTVVATNSVGNSPASSPSNSVTPTVAPTVPGAPTIGTATAGNTSATVTFTAPANNGGAAITGYTVTSNPGNITKTGTTSPISVTGLTNGTAYTFTVKATNSVGTSPASSASNSVTPVTVPTAPTAVTGTVGNGQVTVSFTAPANTGGAAITGYIVTSSPGAITATGTTSPILVTGLTNNTAYTFTVVATNSAGNSAASTPSTAVTPITGWTVPGVPTAVTAAAGNASASVTFTAPASTGGTAITGYTVTSIPAGGVDSNAATTGLTHTITGLTNGTAYTFTVVATNSVGNSPASSPSNAVTPALTPVTGTVTGTWVEGVTITAVAAVGGTATTQTDAAGNYSFNLSSGSYTLTPSLPGYTFLPANLTVAVPAGSSAVISGNNFVATSAITSYSISGTVNYAGAKTGAIRVQANYSGCTNCGAAGGTMIAAPGAYTIRGLQPGSYVITAQLDAQGTGQANANNPVGSSAVATIKAANLPGINVAMTDPVAPTPVALTGVLVSPSLGAAFVQYNPPVDVNGLEIATSYKVDSATDAAFTLGMVTKTFPAQGTTNQSLVVMSGLTNVARYFRITAFVGATASAASPTTGPITIGPTAGLNTVSGSVTFTGAATGPMIVGAYDQVTQNVYFTTIAAPVSPQAYTFSGVPAGSYANFAVIDMNNNGRIDGGDIHNTGGNPPTINVAGATTGNITLSNAKSHSSVNTDHLFDGVNHSYNVIPQVSDGVKRVVSAVLFSGPNVAVPLDMSNSYGNFQGYMGIGAIVPVIGDTYQFKLTYADASTQIVSASVTAVLNSFATALAVNVALPYNRNVPQFTWAAPNPLPLTSYLYDINVNQSLGGQIWYFPQNANGLPSTTLSAVYNSDGSANPASLVTGTLYTWTVRVKDANGNSASYQAPTYTP